VAKRRNRDKKPNIPQETLDRARQQVGAPNPEEEIDAPEQVEEMLVLVDDSDDDDSAERPALTAAPITGATRAERRAGRSSRRSRSAAAASTAPVRARTRKQKGFEEMSHEEIEEILRHPTKEVSEEELHRQYGYVLTDLRNMGVLAAVLFVALILVAQFL
jgi:hypothetical protein